MHAARLYNTYVYISNTHLNFILYKKAVENFLCKILVK